MEISTQMNKKILRFVILLNFAFFVQYGFSMSYSVRTNPIEDGVWKSGIIWNRVATTCLDSIMNADSLTLFLDSEVINVHVHYSYNAGSWHYIHYSLLETDELA